MRTDRIVQRHSQREQLQNLKTMMKESKPLIEADKQLRKAYMAGYRRRVEEEIAEDKAKQEALQGSLDPAAVDEAISQELSPDSDENVKLLHMTDIAAEMETVPSELEQKQNKVQQLFEQSLKPGHNAKHQGTTQANQ